MSAHFSLSLIDSWKRPCVYIVSQHWSEITEFFVYLEEENCQGFISAACPYFRP